MFVPSTVQISFTQPTFNAFRQNFILTRKAL